MATLVGTQANFADALRELVELDYDAIEAYEAAINRLENESYKDKLDEFKKDHERHVKELNDILLAHGEKKVEGPDAKQWLAKGKVVLANMMGDESILQAMRTNEEDTNTAYEKLNNHESKWSDASDALRRGLEDEKRHKRWIEENGGASSI